MAICGKENGPFCLRTRSVTPSNLIVRGSVPSWRGRVNAACHAKSYDSIRFSRTAAASSGRSSRLRLSQRQQRANSITRLFPASPQLRTLNGCEPA